MEGDEWKEMNERRIECLKQKKMEKEEKNGKRKEEKSETYSIGRCAFFYDLINIVFIYSNHGFSSRFCGV